MNAQVAPGGQSFAGVFTPVNRFSKDTRDRIGRVAAQHRGEFVDFGEISPERLAQFHSQYAPRLGHLHLLRKAYQELGHHNAVERYEFEYGTSAWENLLLAVLSVSDGRANRAELEAAFREPNYGFWCPLEDRRMFEQIVGPLALSEGRVVDVGCGFGALLFRIKEMLGLEPAVLFGLDISAPAIQLLNGKGVEGKAETLSQAHSQGFLGPRVARLVCLSYFVDRDDNQRGTFEAAAAITMPRGKIVVDGLFPVKPEDSLGTRYDGDSSRSITRGESAEDDIARIVQFMATLGCALERICTGERLVWSMDGFELLSSTYLVFKRGYLN